MSVDVKKIRDRIEGFIRCGDSSLGADREEILEMLDEIEQKRAIADRASVLMRDLMTVADEIWQLGKVIGGSTGRDVKALSSKIHDARRKYNG